MRVITYRAYPNRVSKFQGRVAGAAKSGRIYIALLATCNLQLKMKSLCLLAVILGLCTLPISSQDLCPAGRVCPANIPVRSDVSNAAGTCDGGDTIR